jgi:hypothetical protein
MSTKSTIEWRIDHDERNDEYELVLKIREAGTVRHQVSLPKPASDFDLAMYAEYLFGKSGSESPWGMFGRQEVDRIEWLNDVFDMDDHAAIEERLDYETCTEEIHAICIWFQLRWEFLADGLSPSKIHEASQLANEALEWAIAHVSKNVEVIA